jgi:hypothetical protein
MLVDVVERNDLDRVPDPALPGQGDDLGEVVEVAPEGAVVRVLAGNEWKERDVDPIPDETYPDFHSGYAWNRADGRFSRNRPSGWHYIRSQTRGDLEPSRDGDPHAIEEVGEIFVRLRDAAEPELTVRFGR